MGYNVNEFKGVCPVTKKECTLRCGFAIRLTPFDKVDECSLITSVCDDRIIIAMSDARLYFLKKTKSDWYYYADLIDALGI